MAEEIELKLALPEAAQRGFLRHPVLRQASHKQACRLTNLYYDTPKLELRARGIALRLRAQGRFWLQSVKCAGTRAGGLSARPEWETPYGGQFDFDAIDDAQVRDWLTRPKISGRIAPVFETHFQRIAWAFEPVRGTRIELALDRGWIAAAGRREAISEVEIELIEGDPGQLFAFALALAQRAPLAPAPLSKAERGYRLFLQQPETAVRAAPIPLAETDSPLGALRAIALGCVDHLQRNHEGALRTDDPEYIHQMRVALRRLRAALRLFAPRLPEAFVAGLLPALRELMGMLGTARDCDVLQTEIVDPVLRALPGEPRLSALAGVIAERRCATRHNALRLLRSPHYGELMIEVLAQVHGLTATPGAEAAATPVALPDYAADRLRRLRRKTLALAVAARSEDPAALHALRIGIKRLRYALEFFAPLAGPKPTRKLLDRLTELQDTLGQINDLANAGALLTDCAGTAPPLREAVTLIAGWHGPRHQKLLAAVPQGLERLDKLRLPKFRRCNTAATSPG
ncbi:MAG: CHAD domain-containing protein [Sulfuritalea sp.]|nr:CHAD domain-containing protein [Sulfuritalea sp.]